MPWQPVPKNRNKTKHIYTGKKTFKCCGSVLYPPLQMLRCAEIYVYIKIYVFAYPIAVRARHICNSLTHTRTQTQIHTHVNTHKHTHIHTCTQTQNFWSLLAVHGNLMYARRQIAQKNSGGKKMSWNRKNLKGKMSWNRKKMSWRKNWRGKMSLERENAVFRECTHANTHTH